MGRADDSMNLGGVKVSAIEIETIINEHSSVIISAAVIKRDEQGPGKLIIYFEGLETKYLKKELQQRINQRLNPLFKISELIHVESLPRTSSGKLIRKKLRVA